MIDFDYTAPELLPFRIQEVLDAPNEPHRIGGVVYVPESASESHWFELFGTPERAAQTMALMCECSPECSFCLLKGRAENICGNGDYGALLEWLRGEGDR